MVNTPDFVIFFYNEAASLAEIYGYPLGLLSHNNF